MQQTIRRVALNTGILVATLGLCLAITELVLRIAGDAPSTPLRVDPENTLAFIPNVTTEYVTDEFRFHVTANSHGRRDRHWTGDVLSAPGNVLFIGDSFVMGYGVEDEHSIPSVLETMLATEDHTPEVFNFGIGGEVALPEYAELLSAADRLGINSRTVLLGVFIGNDFKDLPANATPIGETDPEGAPPEEPVPSLWSSVNIRNLRTFEFVRDRVKASPTLVGWTLSLGELLGTPVYESGSAFLYQKPYPTALRERLTTYLSLILQIRDRCARRGATLTIVILPNKVQVENFQDLAAHAHMDPLSPNRALRDFCTSHELRCLDVTLPLRERFLETGRALYFPKDRHLTVEGNGFVAGEIYKFLRLQ